VSTYDCQACSNGDADIAEILLKSNSNINQCNKWMKINRGDCKITFRHKLQYIGKDMDVNELEHERLSSKTLGTVFIRIPHPVFCFRVDYPASGQYNYIYHRVTLYRKGRFSHFRA
jgi:hypothetical protein